MHGNIFTGEKFFNVAAFRLVRQVTQVSSEGGRVREDGRSAVMYRKKKKEEENRNKIKRLRGEQKGREKGSQG